MKKNNNEHVSSMQVEVWKMKNRVYKETEKMNCSQFFNYIKNKSKKFHTDRKNSVRT